MEKKGIKIRFVIEVSLLRRSIPQFSTPFQADRRHCFSVSDNWGFFGLWSVMTQRSLLVY